MLAAEGIAFTVLAPRQAARGAPGGAWRTGPTETGRAYRCPLPSGRSIDLFFYDGATSQAVAFERLLVDGHRIIARMTGRGPIEGGGPVLCHVATDGETYGHHHRYGDMALAWALNTSPRARAARGSPTTPQFRAAAARDLGGRDRTRARRGAAPTAWRAGGTTAAATAAAGPAGTSAAAPAARRARLAPRAGRRGARGVGRLLDSAIRWAARDANIGVVLARTAGRAQIDAARDRFLAEYAAHPLDAAERVRALSLMEMARHAMLMYTSCGWFFDDLSGIETVQCMQYAARAAELLEDTGGDAVEPALVERLALARSNLAEEGDGAQVWARRVLPARVAAEQICAYSRCARSSGRRPRGPPTRSATGSSWPIWSSAGPGAHGRGPDRVRSQLTEAGAGCASPASTWASSTSPAACSGRPEPAAWRAIAADLTGALDTADVFAARSAIERHFPDAPLSLSALLPGTRERGARRGPARGDRRRRGRAGARPRRAPAADPVARRARPARARGAAHDRQGHAAAARAREPLRADEPSLARLREHLAEAEQVRISLDTPEIALAASEAMHRMIVRVGAGADGAARRARRRRARDGGQRRARSRCG